MRRLLRFAPGWTNVFILTLILAYSQAVPSAMAGVVLSGAPVDLSSSFAARLEPAREQLRKGNLAECRKLAAQVVSEVKDLPHPDVLVSFWLSEMGNVAACHQLLEQLSKSAGDRSDVHFAFAELARKLGRNFDAWTHLNAAQAAAPPDTWSPKFAEEFAASILLSKAGVAELREDWTAAARLYQGLKASGVSGPTIEIGLGRAAFLTGEFDQAEKHFREAAQLAPDRFAPELLMASLYASRKKSEEADSWYKRGEQENAAHAERIRLEHAMWLLREQRVPEAMQLAKAAEAEKEAPLADEFAVVRGLAYYMYERYDDSVAELSPLARKNPANWRVTNQLALALVESEDEGKRGRAMQLAQANAKSMSDSADVLASLAWIEYRLGDISAAQRTTAYILGRGGQMSRDSAYFLSEILKQLDQTAEAEQLLTLARNTAGDFLNARRLARKLNEK